MPSTHSMLALGRAAFWRAMALAWLGATAAGQGVNIDLGEAAIPSNDYGGAAGQPGMWNVVLPAAEGDLGAQELRDLQGERTGVQVMQSGVSAWTQCPTGLMGDASALLEDAALSLSGTQTWTFSGLSDGDYLVYTYAWPGCLAEPGRVLVIGSPDEGVCCGDYGSNAWAGHHIVGQSFALHQARVVGGELTVLLETGDRSAGARLCGLQLVPLSESGESPASHIGKLARARAGDLVVRRSPDGSELILNGLASNASAALWADADWVQGAPFPRPRLQLVGVAPSGETRRMGVPVVPPSAAGALTGSGWTLVWRTRVDQVPIRYRG